MVTVRYDGTNFQMITPATAAASASAAAAASSATDAETAQTAAEAAQAAAETAQSNAETAQSGAETAETNAGTSATNAANSANAAAASAAELPTISGGDAYKIPQANAGETAQEYVDGARIDILSSDGTKVLENGTDGSDATFTGSASKHGVLNVKTIDIGDWDMDTNQSTGVNHGLTGSKIRAVTCLIRNDADTTLHDLNFTDGTGTGANGWYATSTQVQMFIETDGIFDSVNYDATSFNRGFITIWYTD
jgi:hypothetical protein